MKIVQLKLNKIIHNLNLRLIDHSLDICNYGYDLCDFNASFGRPLPFSKSDAILILFLHDLEKSWRIDTKEAFKKFRENKLTEYNLVLSNYQLNGLTYVEGELSFYSSTHRVMNELAAFCHQCDN